MTTDSKALIVIDVQNDFCPGGALAVTDGDAIIPRVNRLLRDYGTTVLTQDWHPSEHTSFASNHADKKPYETVDLVYGPQVLWPDHCVQGSEGARFHPDLDTDRADLILRKGFRREIDSYSAFFENDRITPTGLEGYLRSRGVSAITLVGLATDFCVAYSAIDGATLGFEVTVLNGACRGIDLDGSLARAIDEMRDKGVILEE